MGEELVSQAFFYTSGSAHQTPAPDVSVYPDENRDTYHAEGIEQQAASIDRKRCKIVDGVFNDAGDKELQPIDDDQAEQSGEDSETILDEIGYYQGRSFLHKVTGRRRRLRIVELFLTADGVRYLRFQLSIVSRR